MTTGRTKGLNI